MKRIMRFTAALSLLCVAGSAGAWTLPVPGSYQISGGNDFWSCSYRCHHLGDDVTAAENTEIVSVCSGIVMEVAYTPTPGNYGGRVIVECATEDGYITALYGHLGPNTPDALTSDIFVSEGDWVNEGEALGRIGGTNENGGWAPHLHFGIHRGPYLGSASECGRWTYAGYTAEAYGTSDECFCNVLDNWIDPSVFLGLKTPELRVVSGGVSPSSGAQNSTTFTWSATAAGGRSLPVTATAIIKNPATGLEYGFNMSPAGSPGAFTYSGQALASGMYSYRFALATCGDSYEETAWRNGPNVSAPCSPSAEVCDNTDNDCDGLKDEGLSQWCYALPCGNVGTKTCAAGVWSACSAVACPACMPTTEICDGTDNDCDNLTDENLSQSCANECENTGIQTCSAGSWGACSAALCPACVPTGTENCDGDDNDCDGAIDENLSRSCANGCGGTGSETCASGAWYGCTAPACPTLPAAPALTSPASGAIVQAAPGSASTSIMLVWGAVSGAASYEYEIRAAALADSGAVAAGSVITGMSVSFSRTNSYFGTGYQWKVRAKNPAGEAGPWSSARIVYFSYTGGSVIACVSADCPAPNAWYLVSSDIQPGNNSGNPSKIILDWISLACTAGRTPTDLPYSAMTGYYRSARYGGCP